jgi:hypothetical protein
MKTKLLKKLRCIGRNRVSINSVTRTTTWKESVKQEVYKYLLGELYPLPQLRIFCIEKAIHCGFFNKEYLNK